MNELEKKALLHIAKVLAEPSQFITEYGIGRLSLALELLADGKTENIICPLKQDCDNACCCCDDVFIREILDHVRDKDFCYIPLTKKEILRE